MPNTKRCLSFEDSPLVNSIAVENRNSFFHMPVVSFTEAPVYTISDTDDDEKEGRSISPTAIQRTLCLNATSDVDVSLTDEEMSSSPGGVWPHGIVAPACSRKQSVAEVALPAFGGPGFCKGASLSLVGGGACVCTAPGVGSKPLFSKSQLKAANVSITGNTDNINMDNGDVQKTDASQEALLKRLLMIDSAASISFPSKQTPITDEYCITHEIIGVGESGRVMACFSRTDNKKYALKVLRDGPRSRREVHLHYLASKHENIVSIIDIFENTFEGMKCLLIVVEFLEGGDLLTRFEKQGRFPYSKSDVAQIINQLASAIKFLHELNIAHRDIKLENILCSSTDTRTCTYKLADFGFAKRSDRNKLMESPCCTPTYVCPEILSHERYNKSCDMWAVGVVMYILLCGYPPFYSMKGQPFSPGMRERITVGLYAFPTEDWQHISEDAKNVIRNLLRTDPTTRATVDEVLNSKFLRRYFPNISKIGDVCGLKTIWSDSSLSSLDDYKSTKSTSPSPIPNSRCLDSPDYESTDSALGYSSGGDCCTLSAVDNDACSNDCETTTDDDSEASSASAFKFPSSKVSSLKTRSDYNNGNTKFVIGYRSCQRPPSAKTTVTRASKQKASASSCLPHHFISARCFDTASEMRVAAGPPIEAKPARLCSIQEEVNRALDLMRLGADDLVLSLPRNAATNNLLERRRQRAIANANKTN